MCERVPVLCLSVSQSVCKSICRITKSGSQRWGSLTSFRYISSDTGSNSSYSSSDTASSQSSPEGSEVEEIHPFLYEPIVRTSSGEDSSDSDEDLSLRLLNLNW